MYERVHASLAPARARLTAHDSAVLDAQIAVSEIPAPTGHEGERARWIADRFRALGLQAVRVDDAGNVIGRRVGSTAAPAVVVCAHMDTVFPADVAVRVRRDGDHLVGPGICDNGRGLAGMLALASAIDGVRLRTRSPIDFVATTGEEGLGNLRGARAFFEREGRSAAAVVALDGAGDERIVHRGLSSRRYRVTFRGPGGHSWAAYGVPNPVHAAGTAIAMIGAMSLPREPRTTVTVGRVAGGMSVNAIPEEGWFELDLRSTAPALIERYDREIRTAVRAAEAAENTRRAPGTCALRTVVEIIGDRPGGTVAASDPLVVAAVEATSFVGRTPDLATASTDANVPISMGIPAITLGAGGRGGDTHTVSEWYENVNGSVGLARALTVVVASAGLGGVSSAP
jgi:acetylornithine deacetylase/succinyl-diaminopimelate desuccinylase-like protein